MMPVGAQRSLATVRARPAHLAPGTVPPPKPFRSLGVALDALAKRHAWRRMVMLGAGDGEALRHLLASCRDLELLVVEDWQDPPGVRPCDKWGPNDGGDRHREDGLLPVYRERVRMAVDGNAPRTAWVQQSPLCYTLPEGAPAEIDVVLVQHGHGPGHAAAAIVAWGSKLRPGGWLCGLDWRVPGTTAWLNKNLLGWQRLDGGLWAGKVGG